MKLITIVLEWAQEMSHACDISRGIGFDFFLYLMRNWRLIIIIIIVIL